MFTMVRRFNKQKYEWLVVDWPTTSPDFPIDLTESCNRRGEEMPDNIFDIEPPPLLVACCSKRDEARQLVRLARNGDIHFFRTD